MTGIINGQCAVEQPQRFTTPLEFVGTDISAEADLFFFNHLAIELKDGGSSNSIDSWEYLGHYEAGATRDLGSRT
jgi:hypothetical protein